jgi:hypothetical protein
MVTNAELSCQLPVAGCPLYNLYSADFLDTDLGRVYKKAFVDYEDS